MDKRAVIIAGGGIYDDLALSFVQKDSYIIAADRGLVFLAEHDIVPDLIVGDFDSAPEETRRRFLASHPGIEVREYNWEKDYTDLEIAAAAAADRGAREIVILGATGTRRPFSAAAPCASCRPICRSSWSGSRCRPRKTGSGRPRRWPISSACTAL